MVTQCGKIEKERKKQGKKEEEKRIPYNIVGTNASFQSIRMFGSTRIRVW